MVLPARPRKPRDKAKAEAGVLLVERWILARLRKYTFFNLADLNREIQRLLQTLNTKQFKRLPGTRHSRFCEIDQPALKPLPYVLPTSWPIGKRRPSTLIIMWKWRATITPSPIRSGEEETGCSLYRARTVECFYRNRRIASHLRSTLRGRHTTVKEHMPLNHQKYSEWNPERFKRWAAKSRAAGSPAHRNAVGPAPTPTAGLPKPAGHSQAG